jgi:hypothetical protein
MRKLFLVFLFFIFFDLFVIKSFAQTTKLKSGFETEEFLELLKVSSRQGDALYSPDLPAPKKFQKIDRLSEKGLDNRWDFWVNEDKVACMSIRGATSKQVCWHNNFFAAMVPAKGSLKLNSDFLFNYNLSNDHRSTMHIGWLISTACFSRDILPIIDSLYHSGYSDICIISHSQGRAISYLLSALLLKQQKTGGIPAEVRFKTYCSAAGDIIF